MEEVLHLSVKIDGTQGKKVDSAPSTPTDLQDIHF